MIRPDRSKIVVPRRQGEVLIEPGLGELAGAARGMKEAGVRAVMAGKWFGGDFQGLREFTRQQLVYVAGKWAGVTGGKPLPEDAARRAFVITGHQVEFYHAGVWAKVIAADEVARRAGGEAIAFDILVDHDVVDELGFDVPAEREDGTWARELVRFGESAGMTADSLRAPGPGAFEQWEARLGEFSAARVDSLAFYLESLRAGLGTGPEDGTGAGGVGYTQWMSGARQRFEESMGLRVVHVPSSLVCWCESWFIFVRAWVEHAEKFGEVYNLHLREYRKRERIKNKQRPMPDLQRDVGGGGNGAGGEFELPFWVYRVGEARERMMMRREGPRILLRAGETEMDVTNGLAAVIGEGFVIRPRALTLTMYVRLFLADVFIHGIGGAMYDQVTDGIMEELFGVVPPYGCVSAAWLLPPPSPGDVGVSDMDVSRLKWKRHHLVNNPQLGIDAITAVRTDVAELIKERRDLVEGMARSLAEARRDKAARRQRREWFGQLHAVNGLLHAKVPGVLERVEREIAGAQEAVEQGKVWRWREWFFGLHARASLERLVEQVRHSG